MRLTVLGGSSASPNAGMGCSGYLVETATTRIVLDLGPGTLQEFRRHADMRTLDAVIVSHMHLDHVLDLLTLRHALAYNPIPAPGPVPVWLPPGGMSHLHQATAPFDACDEPGRFASTVRVGEYDPGAALAIGDLTITCASTVHDLPTWAMRVSDGSGRDLGYTADTGPSADLVGFFTDVAVLIAEATLREPGPRPWAERGSLTATEAGVLARDAAAARLILTHLWEEFSLYPARELAAAVFSGPVEVARPGLRYEW